MQGGIASSSNVSQETTAVAWDRSVRNHELHRRKPLCHITYHWRAQQVDTWRGAGRLHLIAITPFSSWLEMAYSRVKRVVLDIEKW
jgi:hypothetical protein